MSARAHTSHPHCPAILRRGFLALAAAALLPGCMIVDIGVTNPVRGLRSVAVVPFFNQSSERAADGRLMAELYARELQKTPGVEVIPVGVVETTMRTYGLQNLSGPDDAVKLAALLNADAVVIGTITEYSAYEPPRVGLSVAWYSPYRLQFDNGPPVDAEARDAIQEELTNRRREDFETRKRHFVEGVEDKLDHFMNFHPPEGAPKSAPPTSHRPQPVPPLPDLLMQSMDAPVAIMKDAAPKKQPVNPAMKQPAAAVRPKTSPNTTSKSIPVPPPPTESSGNTDSKSESKTFLPPIIEIRGQSPEFRSVSGKRAMSRPAPLRPIMSYTKVVDAADEGTAAAFRDFLELTGDDRGGDWTARLLWADEFNRFAAHVMIVEMFQLHGGEARKRVVLKLRKHR